MVEHFDIDRSVKRRVKQARTKAGGRTVHKTGEPAKQVPLVEPPLSVEGRRFDSLFPETALTYNVGGIPKRRYRWATVIRKEADECGFGQWEETRRPAPGDTIINGLSDKVVNPVRVQRSSKRRNGKGTKGGQHVVR